MYVFVYEFVTGGGMWSLGEPPAGSLLAEGRAMVEALADDLAAIGANVLRLLDVRLGECGRFECIRSAAEERAAFLRNAGRADWTIVIAPETSGSLLARSQWVREAGGRLLSPGPATVELAGDKQRTGEHLARRSLRVPPSLRLPEDMRRLREAHALFPAVIKPINGCGSQGVRLVESAAQLARCSLPRGLRLEQFVPGTAASVAVLGGPGVLVALPACEQILSQDGRFAYLGGRVPMPDVLSRRGQALALAAARTLPPSCGYLGVDLVLGSDPGGAADYVIEINPRLTTSYVGLRALCRESLAAAMIAAAQGREPALTWHERAVEFTAAGRVTRVAGKGTAGTHR